MKDKTIQLKARTQAFFQAVIKLTANLPHSAAAARITPQLLDSAGSTASNYRSACRARSKREFIAKVGVAREEADESMGWLESLLSADIGDAEATEKLIQEANELVAMLTASAKTASKNLVIEEATRRKKRP